MGVNTKLERAAETVRSRARQHFISSVLLYVAWPLLPLLLELILDHGVRTSTLLITTMIYVLGVVATSKNVLVFVLAVLAAVFYAFLYGTFIAGARSVLDADGVIRVFADVTLAAAFVTQTVDRWKVHVVDNRPVFGFMEEE